MMQVHEARKHSKLAVAQSDKIARLSKGTMAQQSGQVPESARREGISGSLGLLRTAGQIKRKRRQKERVGAFATQVWETVIAQMDAGNMLPYMKMVQVQSFLRAKVRVWVRR